MKIIKVVFLIDSLQTGGTEKSLIKLALSFKQVKPIFITPPPWSVPYFPRSVSPQTLINPLF